MFGGFSFSRRPEKQRFKPVATPPPLGTQYALIRFQAWKQTCLPAVERLSLL
jgi:hypothetical protein